MTEKILVMCASRGRPDRLQRMIASVEKTSTKADVVVYVDQDQADLYAPVKGDFRMLKGPRIGQCRSLDHIAKKCPGYQVYGAATDDCTFVTPGWDDWTLKAAGELKGGIGLIAPFSGEPERPRMDFPWATRKWIDVVGSFTGLETYHSYWDVALQILGEQTAIRFAEKDEFELWHESLDPKNQMGVNSTDVGVIMFYLYHVHNDARTVCWWLAHERQKVADRLNEAIGK